MTLATLLAQEESGSILPSLILFALIPAAMYFFLIRPQRRRMKDQAAVQSSLGVGDEVITTSGVYGFITGEEDGLFWLEIDDDVQIRIARAAIQGKAPVKAESADSEADDESDADAS